MYVLRKNAAENGQESGLEICFVQNLDSSYFCFFRILRFFSLLSLFFAVFDFFSLFFLRLILLEFLNF